MKDCLKFHSFGGWLKEIRLNNQTTLRGAAKILSMDPAYLSRLERDEICPPCSAKTIDRICKKLNSPSSADLLKSLALQHHLSATATRFNK